MNWLLGESERPVESRNAAHAGCGDQDSRIQVQYDGGTDSLVFMGMDGRDENYVAGTGAATIIVLNASSSKAAQFSFLSEKIGHVLQVVCMKETKVAKQLVSINNGEVMTMAAL